MTEEKEQSSEMKDEDLDTAASAEEETSPADKPVTEPKVPLHEHTALRQRAQAAEIAQARAEGELVAIKQQSASDVLAAKSPLDLEVERQVAMGIPEEDMTITPALYRRQYLHDMQVANQAAEANRKNELGVVQLASANKAKAAHEDWQEVVAAGDGLLTPGEVLDIAATGEGFGEMYYVKLQAAIERNKPKSESETNTAPETKPSKLEAEPKVPTQQEILKGINADPQTIVAAQL